MTLGKTMTETLRAAGNFKTFLKVIEKCGARISGVGGGRTTLFAPNDAAFARMGPGVLRTLLEGDMGELKRFVEHHTLPGRYYTTKVLKGVGFWEGVEGGCLEYEGLGPIVRVGKSRVLLESSNKECDDGIIHVLESPIIPKWLQVKPDAVDTGVWVGDSTIKSYYGNKTGGEAPSQRERNAGLPGTVGGRKAMGLIKQLPFWMYGPPFNAAYQEDYEPISIAQPEGASVDYQVMPPGTVIVTPDSVNSNDLNPVSGYSKYIGNTKRCVEGAAQSDYSKLDN